MAEEIRVPGYIAILPAKVRYDNDLAPNAKLLYAEITALADKRGYCWTSNDYFARLFDLTGKSVSRLISTLNDKGHITVEVLRDPVTQAVIERRIWVDTPPLKKEDTSPHDGGDLPPKKEGTPPPKKEDYNNPNKLNDIPPISPKREKRPDGLGKEAVEMLETYKQDKPPELAAALDAFMVSRKERKAGTNVRALELFFNKLDKLSGGNNNRRLALINEAEERGWKTVYPLKDDKGVQGKPDGEGQGEDGEWL